MKENDGRVVSNFITQALTNKSITIYGKGSQTRSFCYVDDLIKGMYKMMEQDKFIGPINLGNPEEFTIKQLAEKIILLTRSTSKINYFKLPEDDPARRKPDISLADKVLQWEPKIKIDEGLKRTIGYFKSLANILTE